MIKLADIFFIMGAGTLLLYLLFLVIRPSIIRERKDSLKKVILFIPIILFLLSFSGYYLKSKQISDLNSLNTNNINNDLDSLNNALKKDTISKGSIDTIIVQIQKRQEEIKRLEYEQNELRRRIRTKEFNKRISDSLLYQINLRLQELKVQKDYSIEKVNYVMQGKDGKAYVLSMGGKSYVIQGDQKVNNDIYTIDSLDISPILKKVDFNSRSSINNLNFYIDSIALRFKVVKNAGKSKNTRPDSVLYCCINPIKTNYSSYKEIVSVKKDTIYFMDSLKFTLNTLNEIIIDFPNTSSADTNICFEFRLRRGLISSYCMSF